MTASRWRAEVGKTQVESCGVSRKDHICDTQRPDAQPADCPSREVLLIHLKNSRLSWVP